MGLSQGIQNALGGLRATQMGIELAARNVANANTDGYTKKTLTLSNKVVGDRSFGVQVGAVTRQVDRFLQTRIQSEYADFNKLDVQTQFLDYVDNLFGRPGADGSLDTVVNSVSTALVDFANAPQMDATRQQLVVNADYMATHLRDMSAQIQEMRQNIEQLIGVAVTNANDALSNIARVNHQLNTFGEGTGTADLKDQLDNYIDDLSALMGVRTIEGTNGSVKVFTENGILLVDSNAVYLDFDQRASIGAGQTYSMDDTERGVGTIKIASSSSSGIDLLQQDAVKSGRIAGLLELRDTILTSAQNQLDELAHGLASAFSTNTVAGTDVTVGANTGQKLDLAALQNGNVVEFDFKDNLTGLTHKLSFVKVDDASLLPLDDNVTAINGDKVFGIDFSGTMASVHTQIEAAINSQNTNFTTTLVGASEIQIVDDGAVGNVDVVGLTGYQTVNANQGQGTALNLFTDISGLGEINYSNALESGGQKVGFASRIQLNSLIANDNTLLVKHTATTSIGDQTRAADLLSRFTGSTFVFNAESGIGSKNSPFTGSLDAFTRQVVATQTSRVERHKQLRDNQEMVLSSLVGRMDGLTKVNVDEEMANLLNLQTAYAANARIVSVVKELMDMIMRM